MTRILVTGGAGFLGSHIVDRLRAGGTAEVFVPRSRDYDLTLRSDVDRCLADARPDVVIHTAARVGGIAANGRFPGSFFRDNALMGVQLIEACRLARIKKFVCLGTICAYPKFTPVPFREEDLWNGYPEETNAAYGIAKKALLVMLQAYRQEFEFPGVYLLPVNLYGPRDNFDPESSHVIPGMIRKFLEARDSNRERVVLWGDGTATREFLYVDDAAAGVIAATERYDGDEPVNLGSGDERSIRDLADLIGRKVGFQGEIAWDVSRPNGQPRRRLDTTRAVERFGWRAETALDEGLDRTIAWYQEHRPDTTTVPAD
ncbi:MAG: GDP-L-fucose synthase [Thermoanaerobaculia bacterium]